MVAAAAHPGSGFNGVDAVLAIIVIVMLIIVFSSGRKK